jgi:hypothetical protein
LLKESKGTASSFNLNPKNYTQVVGRAINKADNWQVRLAGKKANALGLGNEVVQGKLAAKTD